MLATLLLANLDMLFVPQLVSDITSFVKSTEIL